MSALHRTFRLSAAQFFALTPIGLAALAATVISAGIAPYFVPKADLVRRMGMRAPIDLVTAGDLATTMGWLGAALLGAAAFTLPRRRGGAAVFLATLPLSRRKRCSVLLVAGLLWTLVACGLAPMLLQWHALDFDWMRYWDTLAEMNWRQRQGLSTSYFSIQQPSLSPVLVPVIGSFVAFACGWAWSAQLERFEYAAVLGVATFSVAWGALRWLHGTMLYRAMKPEEFLFIGIVLLAFAAITIASATWGVRRWTP